MRGYSKKISRLIREFKMEAHERELRRELTKLDQSFAEWRDGKIGSGELSNRVHEYDIGPSRDLFKRYNSSDIDMWVAYAIVVGILDRDEVPDELLEALERQISSFQAMKDRNELRIPE